MFYLKDYLTLRVLDFLKNKYEKKKITKTKKKKTKQYFCIDCAYHKEL